MSARLIAAASALCLVSEAAVAAEVPCWLDQGVLVAPAQMAGLAGDFIIDTGAVRSALHNTRAQSAGIDGERTTGAVRLAGHATPAQELAIVDLDAQTWDFPTPIAGVIGTDVLSGFVLELETAPCRLTLSRPTTAPQPRTRGISLALSRSAQAQTIRVGVSDGARARYLDLIPATGLDAAVRLSPGLAHVPGGDPKALGPDEAGRASLRALSLGQTLFENVPTGLTAGDARQDGAVGLAILGRWRMRLDFPNQRLELSPP